MCFQIRFKSSKTEKCKLLYNNDDDDDDDDDDDKQ